MDVLIASFIMGLVFLFLIFLAGAMFSADGRAGLTHILKVILALLMMLFNLIFGILGVVLIGFGVLFAITYVAEHAFG